MRSGSSNPFRHRLQRNVTGVRSLPVTNRALPCTCAKKSYWTSCWKCTSGSSSSMIEDGSLPLNDSPSAAIRFTLIFMLPSCEFFLERLLDNRRHKLAHISAQPGYLFHQPRTDERAFVL